MRLLRTIAALSAVLTPLMAEAAMSRPMPGTTDFPRASNPRVNVPVCFIETTSGTTLDLVSLCGSNAAPPASRNVPPPPAAGNPTNAPNAATPATPNPNGITRDAAGNPTTTPAGTANPSNPSVGNPGTAPTANPNNTNNPGTAPTANPNNTNNPNNPGTAPTANPNNPNNPGTTPTANPNNTNNPNNPNNLNPGAAPYTTPNNLTPPTGNAGDGSSGVVPNPTINLPRVPPSSFGPGGLAPTRDAIDGPR